MSHDLGLCSQAQAREQLASAQAQADSLKGQLEVSQAKLQRLDRSNTHLRKQRTQMLADIQVCAAALRMLCYALLSAVFLVVLCSTQALQSCGKGAANSLHAQHFGCRPVLGVQLL